MVAKKLLRRQSNIMEKNTEYKKIMIGKIPAIIYGDLSDKVYLFVHGQGGNKEEAESFAEIVIEKSWQVISIDLPEHGERKNKLDQLYPWIVVLELQKVWEFMQAHWNQISLRANSIGAWFSMLAFSDKEINKSLFVSPILNMEHLSELPSLVEVDGFVVNIP